MFHLSKSNSINFAKLHQLGKNIYDNIPLVKKKRRRRRIYKIFKFAGLGVITIFLLIIIFFAANFLALKQIYSEAVDGKNNLEQATFFIKSQDFKQAVALANISNNNFSFALAKIDQLKNSFIIKHASYLEKQLNDIYYLLSGAEFLSRAVKEGASLGQDMQNVLGEKDKLSFTKLTKQEKSKILERLYKSGPELNGIKADLDLAIINIEQVNMGGFLFPLANKIDQLKEQLRDGQQLIAKTIPLAQIMPVLAGYPVKASYLVILQNNDELRPTGGFIGSYGILEIDAGEISRFDTHDIYHLDMPIKDKINISPPEQLIKYLGVNKWYLRDANWSPDWPTSASKIAWFYQAENNLLPKPDKINKFDGVIGITPKFIVDLLSIIGPVTIDGVEYNKDNFQTLLEYKVEKGYVQLGIPSWERKEVIGQIASQLITSIIDLPASRWSEVINSLDDNLLKKNILINLSDPEIQDLVREKNWAGEVKTAAGDYFMVVDANMAALKTDAVMSKSINYQVDQGANGLFVKLRINYAHHGTIDWRTSAYRTYTRVYAPLGSQLIKVDGITDGQVKITNELGKTSFGGFIKIEPGKIGSLYFEYKLPYEIEKNLKNKREYQLYAQKQPGSDINEFTVDLIFNNNIKSYNPATFYSKKLNNQEVKWEGEFNTDKSFSVNF